MRRLALFLIIPAIMLLTSAALAQEDSTSGTATCNFDANKQLVAEYKLVNINPKKPLFGREIPSGKVWAPGGKPITLFTNTPVEIGGKQLAIGAYTMYVIPAPKQWMLIVSRSTDTSGTYDETMDLVRVPMESGELPALESQFRLTFVHPAPDQCSLRMDVATVGNWAIFQQK